MRTICCVMAAICFWASPTVCRAQSLPAENLFEGQVANAKPRHTYESLALKLQDPIDLEFVETPLKDVVRYVADVLEVKIVIDAKSLEEAAVGIDTPVTKSLENLSAGAALRLMLDELGIVIVRREEFLEITTPDKLASEMEPRIYYARDLPGVHADQPDVDQAMELIERMVEPKSWKANGGQGDIVHLRTILVIRQTPLVHDQIDNLLRRTREALAQPGQAE